VSADPSSTQALAWFSWPPMRRKAGRSIVMTCPKDHVIDLWGRATEYCELHRPRTRRPRTLDRRLPLDLLCAYLSLQYFALIHVYIRPQPGGSLAASTRLVLIGLGVEFEP